MAIIVIPGDVDRGKSLLLAMPADIVISDDDYRPTSSELTMGAVIGKFDDTVVPFK